MKISPADPKEPDLEFERKMFPHTCTKCGGVLYLPKIYPYIEYVPEGEDECLK